MSCTHILIRMCTHTHIKWPKCNVHTPRPTGVTRKRTHTHESHGTTSCSLFHGAFGSRIIPSQISGFHFHTAISLHWFTEEKHSVKWQGSFSYFKTSFITWTIWIQNYRFQYHSNFCSRFTPLPVFQFTVSIITYSAKHPHPFSNLSLHFIIDVFITLIPNYYSCQPLALCWTLMLDTDRKSVV